MEIAKIITSIICDPDQEVLGRLSVFNFIGSVIIMDWGTYIGGGITATAIIISLSSWLGKVWANRILEQDKAKYKLQVDTLLQDLRTRENKELFVHQLQFEKEFEVYKELWGKVLVLGRAGKYFRSLQTCPVKPLEEAYNDFSDAHNVLNKLVYDNRPFYAPKIFDLSKKLLDTAYDVASSIKRQKIFEQKNDRSEKTVEKLIKLDDNIKRDLDGINILVGEICDAVRERIWSTDKTGWDKNKSDEN